MIQIVQNNKTSEITPHYLLKFNYIIGDANGYTSRKVEVSLENPYIERFVKLLRSLKPLRDIGE